MIVYQYFGFSSTVRFEKARNATILIQESEFEAKKSSKVDKKRFADIYVNHLRSIINQYFGFSSIVRFEKATKPPFLMQGSIFRAHKPLKLDKKRFAIIYANRSYINILCFFQMLGLKMLENTIFNARM